MIRRWSRVRSGWSLRENQGCPSCSFIVDNIGDPSHLHARDTSLGVVTRGPLTSSEPFRERMRWTVPWYSSFGSDFNYDFLVTIDPSVGGVEYNYKTLDEARRGVAGLVRRATRHQRVPAARRPRLPHLFQLRPRCRPAAGHLQLAGSHSPWPPGGVGAAARADHQPDDGLAPASRPLRQLSATRNQWLTDDQWLAAPLDMVSH